MGDRADRITQLITPTVEALGLELWGVEYLPQRGHSLLRVYIEEHEKGVTVEDCEKASRQISALLDVEDPIAGEYTLEVSSPGLDRPLFTPNQYRNYIGTEINLRLRSAIDRRRNFKGKIISVEAGSVTLMVDGTEHSLPFDAVEKANIAY
ncbi:MAG: ribosome maturation factor RimP [Pseudohongiellaceae bacterium]